MAQRPAKITRKDPAEKRARARLTVLQLAEALGSVSEACRISGMDRTSFYEWKRRYQAHGLDGLMDLPPVHKSHPQTTPREIVDRIVALSLDNPTWGCVRISEHLKRADVSVSSPTVQNILIKHGMGSRWDRLFKLEEKAEQGEVTLTEEQLALVDRANPARRERGTPSSRPGETLWQDTFYAGRVAGLGRVYIQAVVDTYGSVGFARAHTVRRPEHAVSVLHEQLLPLYREHGVRIAALVTDHGREYCGRSTHPYELYLRLNGIEHRRTRGRESNGFLERFRNTVVEEFFRDRVRDRTFASVGELQAELDEYLHEYNHERPHRGYRNFGRTPVETLADAREEPAA